MARIETDMDGCALYLYSVSNLPEYVERWCRLSVDQLRGVVGESEAPVKSMDKPQLIRYLADHFMTQCELNNDGTVKHHD